MLFAEEKYLACDAIICRRRQHKVRGLSRYRNPRSTLPISAHVLYSRRRVVRISRNSRPQSAAARAVIESERQSARGPRVAGSCRPCVTYLRRRAIVTMGYVLMIESPGNSTICRQRFPSHVSSRELEARLAPPGAAAAANQRAVGKEVGRRREQYHLHQHGARACVDPVVALCAREFSWTMRAAMHLQFVEVGDGVGRVFRSWWGQIGYVACARARERLCVQRSGRGRGCPQLSTRARVGVDRSGLGLRTERVARVPCSSHAHTTSALHHADFARKLAASCHLNSAVPGP
jgi:hypothetical protein